MKSVGRTSTDITVIIPLYGIEISGNLGGGIKLQERMFITNELNDFKDELTEEWESSLGHLELNSLLEAKAWVYGRFRHQDIVGTRREFLDMKMEVVKRLLMNLWLLRDNAINVEYGFMRAPDGFHIHYDKNLLHGHYVKANGDDQLVVTEYSKEEVRAARELLRRTDLHGYGNTDVSKLEKRMDVGRLGRADYFLQLARNTLDVGIKISLYCSAFETLFSNDPKELSHQLSHRVALIIGSTAEERLEVFKRMKKIYEIRSTITHGGTLKATYADLSVVENTIVCDDYLRRCFITLYSDPKLAEDLFADLTAFFEQRMFGTSEKQAVSEA